MALAGRPNSQIVFLVFAKFSRNYLTTCSRNFHCFIMGILNDLLKFHFSLIQYLFNTYFFVKQMTSKTTRVSYNSQIPSFLVLTKFYRNYETTCVGGIFIAWEFWIISIIAYSAPTKLFFHTFSRSSRLPKSLE